MLEPSNAAQSGEPGKFSGKHSLIRGIFRKHGSRAWHPIVISVVQFDAGSEHPLFSKLYRPPPPESGLVPHRPCGATKTFSPRSKPLAHGGLSQWERSDVILKSLKAYIFIDMKFWCCKSCFIGFLVKFSSKTTPKNSNCDEIKVKFKNFCEEFHVQLLPSTRCSVRWWRAVEFVSLGPNVLIQ